MKAKPNRQRKVLLEINDNDTVQLARSAILHVSPRGSREPRLFGKILVAVFSDTSCGALRLAIQMARLFSSKIFCLHVIEVRGAGEPAFIAHNMKERSAAERDRRRELLQLLKEQD